MDTSPVAAELRASPNPQRPGQSGPPRPGGRRSQGTTRGPRGLGRDGRRPGSARPAGPLIAYCPRPLRAPLPAAAPRARLALTPSPCWPRPFERAASAAGACRGKGLSLRGPGGRRGRGGRKQRLHRKALAGLQHRPSLVPADHGTFTRSPPAPQMLRLPRLTTLFSNPNCSGRDALFLFYFIFLGSGSLCLGFGMLR